MIDSQNYMNEMRKMIVSGHAISMIVSGNSMAPFLINQRDYIYVEPLTRAPQKGDMCFFLREDGTYIMHRVCKVKNGQYWFIGDAQNLLEGPINHEQIFGIITKVKRKGVWISKDSFVWSFFQKIWIRLIPIRRTLIDIYSKYLYTKQK